MRTLMAFVIMGFLAGCTGGDIKNYSTYDVDRDGVMDFICPGMEYDPEDYHHYDWRPEGSEECRDEAEHG
ncbi:MAG: hypothetical protein HOC23_11010 [Halieaceae bacterium]|jgi:hypothetical protein|nr:hypothetical protein [Halieaceae bacterium]